MQAGITGGGIAAALIAEILLKGFGVATGSLPAVAVIMATSLSVRGILSRIVASCSYSYGLEKSFSDIVSQLP